MCVCVCVHMLTCTCACMCVCVCVCVCEHSLTINISLPCTILMWLCSGVVKRRMIILLLWPDKTIHKKNTRRCSHTSVSVYSHTYVSVYTSIYLCTYFYILYTHAFFQLSVIFIVQPHSKGTICILDASMLHSCIPCKRCMGPRLAALPLSRQN